jgi:hypothetical protein
MKIKTRRRKSRRGRGGEEVPEGVVEEKILVEDLCLFLVRPLREMLEILSLNASDP